jgi:DNA-binding transcriptional MerR regulator
MARKYLRITEIVEFCRVDEALIHRLEEERLIRSVTRRKQKLYPLDQVDRIRVAHVLIDELGVNLEGAEVALHMREQIIAMQRQFAQVLRSLGKGLSR